MRNYSKSFLSLLGMFSILCALVLDSYFGILLSSTLILICSLHFLRKFIINKDILCFLFTVFFIIGYPVRGILIGIDSKFITKLCPNTASELTLNLIVGVLGWIFFVYGSSVKKETFLYNYRFKVNRMYFSVTNIFIVIGISLRAIHQAYSNSPLGSNIIGLFANVGFICLLSRLVVYRVNNNKKNEKIIWALIILYALFGIFSGQRSAIFIPIISSIVCIYIISSNLNIKKVYLSALMLIVIFVLSYPALTEIKFLMSRNRANLVGRDRVNLAQEVVTSLEMESNIENKGEGWIFLDSVNKLSQRLSKLEIGAVSTCWGLERWGYLKGKTLIHSIVQFFPRAIWREKPVIGIGEDVYKIQYGGGVGSSTVPVSADFYLNFGFVSLMLGMYFLGRLYSNLNRFVLKQNNPFLIAFLSTVSFDLGYAAKGIPNIFYVILTYGVVCVSFKKLCCVKIINNYT